MGIFLPKNPSFSPCLKFFWLDFLTLDFLKSSSVCYLFFFDCSWWTIVLITVLSFTRIVCNSFTSNVFICFFFFLWFASLYTCFCNHTKKNFVRLNIFGIYWSLMWKGIQNRMHELNIFYLLRVLLSSSIESLIRLDALLFLLENGFEKSYVLYLFNLLFR